MKPAAPVAPTRPHTFPETEIRRRIKEFWQGQTKEAKDNPFAPKRNNTIADVLPDIDSLAVVKFMVRIEEVIDREIPPKFIQSGGYDSCNEMIDHLLPQIENFWRSSN